MTNDRQSERSGHMFDLEQHDRMAREHAAWLDVVQELRERGVGEINRGEKDEPLQNAIVKWGEELVQLRMGDPDASHAETALREKRDLYEGQYEKGTYPTS